MRLAVFLAAHCFKLYLWLRPVPHRYLAYGLYLVAVIVACLMFSYALRLGGKPVRYPDLMCSYPTPPDQDFPLCEFKLRLARND